MPAPTAGPPVFPDFTGAAPVEPSAFLSAGLFAPGVAFGLLGAGVMHQQALKRIHAHAARRRVEILRDFRKQRNAFRDGKKRRLAGIDEQSNHDFIEQAATAGDDVQMPVGHGVKRTGIDGTAHKIVERP